MSGAPILLSPSEILKARRLRRMHWSWSQIAKSLNATVNVVRYSADDEYREHRMRLSRERRAADKRIRERDPIVRDHVQRAARPPDEVLAERDARLATPRTLTATFFGDPPPGFSALDRMSPR